MNEDNMTIATPRTARGLNMNWLRLAATIVLSAALAVPAVAASVPYLRIPNSAAGTVQPVSLEVGKSILIDLPTNAGEVIASNPAVATVIMRSKARAIIQGAGSGNTNIFFLDPAGNNIAVLDLKVFNASSDVGDALDTALARNLPGSRIVVESVTLDGTDGPGTNRIVLSGTVRSQDDMEKAMLMAAQFAGSPDNVANLLTVSGNQQVMLKVTVAEVNRQAVKQFGLDLNVSSGGLVTGLINQPSAALGGASGISTGQGTITASATIGGTTIEATLQALARRNALRTLAEPTLTAMSGQEADFLVGGERAIISRDADGNPVTTYKEYGVKLNFTPTVKSNGRIGLVVDTEVSAPSGTSDFNKRSASTTIEIPAGCTLAIGGLLQDDYRHQISQMPGLGDIPILGALFRSRDFIHSQTELVILVTPVMAEIGNPGLPTDNYAIAGDAEAIFLGRLEKIYGVGNDGMRGSYNGSVGFILD
jgi:pilus assembly protein CpaC